MSDELEGLQELFEKVASHLSGHTVQVRFRKPITTGALGTAMKSGGVGIIDIDPDVSLGEQYKILLHESSHLVNDWDELKDYTFLAPASIPTTRADLEEARAEPIEHAARDMTWAWMKFADYYHFKYLRHSGEIFSRLQALLEWKPS